MNADYTTLFIIVYPKDAGGFVWSLRKTLLLKPLSDEKHKHNEEREEGRRHERERDVAEFKEDALRAIACSDRRTRDKRLSPHLQIMLIERRESAED